MKAIVYHGYDRDHIAPVMDRIPAGFQVWNIGKHAPAGYVLAAQIRNYNVIMSTLCAVALSDHEKQIIDAAAAYGCCNLKTARRMAASMAHNWRTAPARKAGVIAAALAIYENISD